MLAVWLQKAHCPQGGECRKVGRTCLAMLKQPRYHNRPQDVEMVTLHLSAPVMHLLHIPSERMASCGSWACFVGWIVGCSHAQLFCLLDEQFFWGKVALGD